MLLQVISSIMEYYLETWASLVQKVVNKVIYEVT